MTECELRLLQTPCFILGQVKSPETIATLSEKSISKKKGVIFSNTFCQSPHIKRGGAIFSKANFPLQFGLIAMGFSTNCIEFHKTMI